MANINIYTNGTAGSTDGTKVSVDRSFLSAITANINAGSSETAIIPLAIRCDDGYNAAGVTITTDMYDEESAAFTGVSNSMMLFSKNSDGSDASQSLRLGNIANVNVLVYLVITSSDVQTPGQDNNTAVKLTYTLKTNSQ